MLEQDGKASLSRCERKRWKRRRNYVRRDVWEVHGRRLIVKKGRNKRKASPKKQDGFEETVRDIRGVDRKNMIENAYARPNGRREDAETALSCR